MQQELWWQLLEVVNVGMFQVTTKATFRFKSSAGSIE